MKIEVGKYYKTRDGQKVGPMYSFSNHAETCRTLYADVDDEARAFYIDGGKRRFMGNVGDLIAEWVDEPVTGTLHSLKAKERDIVIDSNGVKYCLYQDDIDRWVRDDFRMLERYEDRVYQKHNIQSPVITETVTTQRIEPGVYGRVSVTGTSKQSVELEFVGEYGPTGRSRLNSAELTAAITTLTSVRDALTHNSAK